jgi:hypothetical protein
MLKGETGLFYMQITATLASQLAEGEYILLSEVRNDVADYTEEAKDIRLTITKEGL